LKNLLTRIKPFELGSIKRTEMEKNKKILKLDDIKKKKVLQAPEGYFDGLSGNISSRIKNSKSQKTIVFTPSKQIVWSVAASIALLLVSWLLFRSAINDESAVEDLLANITDQEIITYLEYEDLSSFDLSERVLGDSLNFLENSVIPELEIDGIDQNELMELYEEIG
jgi:hypothetical protein